MRSPILVGTSLADETLRGLLGGSKVDLDFLPGDRHLKPRARTVEEEGKRQRFLGTGLVPTQKQLREELRKQQSQTGNKDDVTTS
jgi:hypothetical protein